MQNESKTRQQLISELHELRQRVVELQKDKAPRKRAMDALAGSADRFRALADSIPGMVFQFVLHQDGSFSLPYINDGILHYAGISPESAMAEPSLLFTPIHPDDQEMIRRAMSISAETLQDFSAEHRLIDTNGELKWFRVESKPQRLSTGDILWNGVSVDITERKRIEEALRESERRFHSIFNSMGEIVALHELICDASGQPIDYRIIECNPAFSRSTGILHERAVGALASRIYGTGEPPYLEVYAHVAQTGKSAQFEDYFAPMQKYFQISAVSAEQGHFVTVSKDITERVQQQREIKLLNRLYRVLSQVSQAVVRATSAELFLEESCRVIVEEGGFLLSWIGYVEEVTSRVVPTAIWGGANDYARGITVYADDRPEGRGPTGSCIRERRHFVYNDFLHDQPTQPWHERAARFGIKAVAAFPIQVEGRVWGALTIYSDEINFFGDKDVKLLEKVAGGIGFGLDNLAREHRRKQAEETLRQSEDRYRRIFDDAVLGIFQSTPEGKILRANPAYARMFGFDSPEEVMSFVNDVAVELYADPPRRKQIVKMIMQTEGPIRVENRYVRKDGRIFIGNLHAWAVRGKDGGFLYLEGFVEDITERKRAEEEKEKLEAELRHAHKMEAVGTLAGGIAHEFNNILGIVLGNAELAAEDMQDSNPARFNLDEIKAASFRARDAVRRLLTFSRKSEESRRLLNLVPAVKEAIKLLRFSIPSSVQIHQNISDECDPVEADPTQIHQIILNLGSNAVHAMEEKGGNLEFSLQNILLDETSQNFDSKLQPGEYVMLKVSDTGSGIPVEIMDRIFDPYFTTKDVGKGTGMGLPVVHGIVEAHGGSIQVESDPGEGTTFKIFFPAIKQIRSSEVKETKAELPTGTERILFIDDEKSIAMFGGSMLERLGYQVKTETDPIRAMEVFASNPGQFDLVITDMTMPGITGDRLIRRVLQIRPDMKTILCTGYSQGIDEERAYTISAKAYALKPLDRKQLAITVRKVLDEKT